MPEAEDLEVVPFTLAEDVAAVLNRLLSPRLRPEQLSAVIDHVHYVLAKHTQKSQTVWWDGYQVGYTVAKHLPEQRDGDEARTVTP